MRLAKPTTLVNSSRLKPPYVGSYGRFSDSPPHIIPTKPPPNPKTECLPNRDSTIYESIYGIEGCESIFRGTLRYGGFSKLLYGIKKLGLMGDEATGSEDWAGVIRSLVEKKGYKNIVECLKAEAGYTESEAMDVVRCLVYLDYEKESVTKPNSIIESFSSLLESKLTLHPDERDLVLMHHDIVGVFEDRQEQVSERASEP